MSPQDGAEEAAAVVVAFDGSATSELALAWAADTATAYRAPLTLLRAHPDAEAEVVQLDPDGAQAVEVLGQSGAEAVREAVAHTRAQHPGLSINLVVHPKAPVDALLDASATARAIVMGSRGLEGFRGLLVGSTTMNVAPHARCPVVVLYQPDEKTAAAKASARHPDEVVVGYDGSVSSDLALAFALDHAQATGLGVAVILVTKGRASGPVEPVADPAALDEDLSALIRSAGQVAETHPQVRVAFLRGVGNPAGLLIAEAAGAPLGVVGARGRGGFTGLVLGSVGLQMLIHAECPVAIVHATAAPH